MTNRLPRRFRTRAARRTTLVLAAALLFAPARPAAARRVRIATFNVEHGIGDPAGEKYAAQKAILRRIDADIVGFQELTAGTSNHWVRLATELGYAHRAWGEVGPFAGNMTVGYFSRFPIRETASAGSPPEARELSRVPLCAVFEVPGAAQPFAVWNMHHKAMFETRDDFRRAVEARRIAGDVARLLRARPGLTEMVILGDMNDDPARAEQTVRFEAAPERLPSAYAPGADLRFPIAYRRFPPDAYAGAGPGFRDVPARRQGSDIPITHFYTNLRLDWIFASESLWRHPDGPPRGEIYHTEWDVAEGGLPKAGAPPAPEVSLKASDHYPVFVDLHLQPAAEER